MSKFKFVLNSSGVRELLQSTEMKTIIQEATNRVTSNAGSGYEGNVQVANRVVGRVFASDWKARRDNYKNNTLLKALHK